MIPCLISSHRSETSAYWLGKDHAVILMVSSIERKLRVTNHRIFDKVVVFLVLTIVGTFLFIFLWAIIIMFEWDCLLSSFMYKQQYLSCEFCRNWFRTFVMLLYAAVDFFNQVNVLYGTLTEFCTPSTCPTMSAGPKYVLLFCIMIFCS